MSISWGKQQRVSFQGAWKLEEWSPPPSSGLFAITYKQDKTNRPKSHTVVYFGQGADLTGQGLPWCHEASDRWLDVVGGARSELYVFFHPMPHSTQLERWMLHERLIAEYRPLCNRP
ncbi:MAG TPA: hypothetical protein V6D08_03155 [Candidatus Obscuribacterales bacterium]